MAFPDDPLDLTVELAIGADIHADPATWDWTDFTSRTEGVASTVSITRGRRSRVGQYAPMQVSAVVDNTDGALARHNPNSTYFGQLKKNTPMRVRVDNGSGPVTRAAAYVPGFPPRWDRTGRNNTVTLKAVGITDRLGRGRVLQSPLRRTMVGVSPDDYQPQEYWSLEEGSSATQFASGLAGGTTVTPTTGIDFASDSDLVSSLPLPVFYPGTIAVFPVRTYTDTGQWAVQMAIKPSATGYPFTVFLTGGTARRVDVALNFSTLEISVAVYDVGGSSLMSMTATIPNIVGEWASVVLSSRQNIGGGNGQFDINLITDDGFTSWSTGNVVASAVYGRPTSIRLAPTTDTAFGHLGLYVNPAFAIGIDDVYNARTAASAWAGEMAHERAERLCKEARVPFTTAATVSQRMGPQTTRRLLDLLRECADVDSGLLVENMDFGITFVSAGERYNLAPSITLDYTADDIMAPWDPTDDDQDYVNTVVASRDGGSSVPLADEDEVDEVGEYGVPITPNVETDGQLTEVGGWRLHLGLDDDLTWPAVSPNIQNNSTLLDDWLATDLGHALHVTDHPEPLAPDTIRQIIEGYTEVWGLHTATATAILSPQAPWDVAELDDDDSGKLDTAGTVMHVAATSGATSFTVHTEVLPKWTTDAGEMPIPILTSGQVNSVTAIANVSSAFVAAGTVAHGNNASVTPTMPAGVQAGDLLLVWAAIRNSGTGTVNTPSGYTVLLQSGNTALLGKIHTGTETAPQITFTGGVANADTSAQMAAFRGVSMTVHASTAQLNSSAQDIAWPALDISRDNCTVLALGWKQDDWTSVTSTMTEIGEPDTATGDDQGITWAYTLQTTAAAIAAAGFTVTGGASAISRGAVIALATDIQTMTVTRGTNDVTKAIAAGEQVNVYRPARLAL